ncbi:MAG TPA: DCC1-like thiol-disulfide oxidoreductase family protein [Gemmatimonadaceae bacterium]|nr:DCC1-like thiol-disulfide oxidoreductase family protein [Gemmatimonadaceae bacterium]
MSAPTLLYDGECGFCDRTVKFALRHDPHGPLRFAALQSQRGLAVRARHPEVAGVDSLLWVEDGLEGAASAERVWAKSDGALRLARYLGGVWAVAAAVARLVPRPLRDAMYDAFARHRYRWFGRADACELPSPEQRARFDVG